MLFPIQSISAAAIRVIGLCTILGGIAYIIYLCLIGPMATGLLGIPTWIVGFWWAGILIVCGYFTLVLHRWAAIVVTLGWCWIGSFFLIATFGAQFPYLFVDLLLAVLLCSPLFFTIYAWPRLR